MAFASLQESIAQLERGKASAAIGALEERLARAPMHATTCVLLARAYEAEARWAEACRAWQRAYFLLPTNPVILDGLHRTSERALREATGGPPAGPSAEAATSAPATSTPRPEDTFRESASREEAPGEEAPGEEAPGEEAPGEEAPGEEAPGEEAPGEEAPSEEAPSEEAPSEEAPSEEAPSEEAPSEEAPGEQFRPEDAFRPRSEDTPATPMFSDEDDDLDNLIRELEGARITPRPDLEALPTPNLEDDLDDLVSETLARIYAAQNEFADAARVYDRLAEQDPARADEYRQQAAAMRARAGEN